MTLSLRIKNFKFDKFGDFLSDIDFKTKTDIFRDDISLIINQCHLQATEGSFRRTQSVRQPRSASKRSALVVIMQHKGFQPNYHNNKKICKMSNENTINKRQEEIKTITEFIYSVL